jgi:transcriptional regulator with XRE-family HTH domain
MPSEVDDQTEIMRFADWLNNMINSSGLSKKGLAHAAKISESSIYRLCASKLPLPTERTIRKIELAVNKSYERQLTRHYENNIKKLANYDKDLCDVCRKGKAETTYKDAKHCLPCKMIALSVEKLTDKQKLEVIKDHYGTQAKMAEVLKTNTSALSRFFRGEAIPNAEFAKRTFFECIKIYRYMGEKWTNYNLKFAQERLDDSDGNIVDRLVNDYGYIRANCKLQTDIDIELIKDRPFKLLVDCKVTNDNMKLMLVLCRIPTLSDSVAVDKAVSTLGLIMLTGVRYAVILIREKIVIVRFNNDRSFTEIQDFPTYSELNRVPD